MPSGLFFSTFCGGTHFTFAVHVHYVPAPFFLMVLPTLKSTTTRSCTDDDDDDDVFPVFYMSEAYQKGVLLTLLKMRSQVSQTTSGRSLRHRIINVLLCILVVCFLAILLDVDFQSKTSLKPNVTDPLSFSFLFPSRVFCTVCVLTE